MADPAEWEIHWASITTPGELLFLMFTQLSPQVDIAITSGLARLASDKRKIENTTTYLAAASSVASFFWPSPSRKKKVKDAYPNRAVDLRHLLGLNDAQPKSLSLIRNDLTHVDERLEERFLENPQLRIVAWGSSTTAAAGTLIYMGYDRKTTVLHSLGEEINLGESVKWFIGLRERLKEASMKLMIMSHRIGQGH